MMRRAALGLLLAAVACEGGAPGWVPRLTIPQYEQTRESVQGGIGRRYEDHAACTKTATDAKSMVACMDAAGYGYLPRSADEQAMECWRIRDLNPADVLPEALCFVRRTEPAP